MNDMRTLTVGLAENKYDILIGDGLLKSLGGLLKPFCSGDGPVAVVTDENVWELHGARFASSLSEAGVNFEPVRMPPGEHNKSPDGLAALYDAFADLRLTRGGLVAAFGGGVVGDLCGFAAATWMRGVGFVQVPTTLLAQVDSSVGGKTAINLPRGKNLVGAFYQPKLVVIDPLTLNTLPEREVKGGMAEAIKYGAISSPSFFDQLGRSGKEKIAPEDLTGVIYECCRIKSEIVARDERDFGERTLLNFGHTLGHAIEKRFGFGRYTHGEAVAFGMVLAADLGERTGVSEPGVGDALRRVLSLYGLETRCPCDPSELLPILTTDKKSDGGGVQMVLLRKIGSAFTRRTTFSELEKLLGKEAGV
jgi:3-dehydroquinate synthase